MSLDDLTHEGLAQRSLVRGVQLALPEGDKSRRVIRDALYAARLIELPREPRALHEFARAYLGPELMRFIAPTLVLAMLADLAAEFELRTSGARMNATTRQPPSVEPRRPTL